MDEKKRSEGNCYGVRWNHPCAGCIHWRGQQYGAVCCNYIFDMDRRRPCPPGEECTVKKTARDS